MALVRRGVSRRTFLKFSAAMAATLALPLSYAPRIAAAVESAPRVPLIWLRGLACGGDSQAFLQSASPTIGELLIGEMSLDYDEAFMAASHALRSDRTCLLCHDIVTENGATFPPPSPGTQSLLSPTRYPLLSGRS